MKGIILAGGLGTRVKHLGNKPLLMLSEKVAICHQIVYMYTIADLDSITIVIRPGEEGKQVKKYLDNCILNDKLNFVVQEKPLGPVNALSKVNIEDETYLIMYCDTILSFDSAYEVRDEFRDTQYCAVSYQIGELEGQGYMVADIDVGHLTFGEKDRTGPGNILLGLMSLRGAAINTCIRNQYSIPELLNDIVKSFTVKAVGFTGRFADAGTERNLKEATDISRSYPECYWLFRR